MGWNYRVIMKQYKEEKDYTIHEVYYDEEGNIKQYSKNPTYPYGYSLDDLKKDYELYGKAFEKPILCFDKKGKLVEL